MIRLIAAAVCLQLVGCSAVPGDAALRAGQYAAALRLYEDQYRQGNLDAGLRLAGMHNEGLGVPKDSNKAFEIYEQLAGKNVTVACHNVGVAYEYGIGTAQDYQKAAAWYRKAASAGHLWSIYNLGTLYANQRMMTADDVEGLALLLQATELASSEPDSATIRFIRNDEAGHVKKMIARMSFDSVAEARNIAKKRPSEGSRGSLGR